MKLLLVEDDAGAARALGRALGEHGHSVEIAFNGSAGLELALQGTFDVLLLDVMLPGLDGFTLLEEIRVQGVETRVIFLTARDGLPDRIRGLTLGKGDYLVKPFAPSELLLRLHNLMERKAPEEEQVFTVGDLSLYPAQRKAYRSRVRLELSLQEYRLLELLLRHAGRVVTRSRIAEELWEMAYDGDPNLVDAAMKRLRRKVDDPFETKIIQTRRGLGYVVELAAG